MHFTTSAHMCTRKILPVIVCTDVRIREGVGVDANEPCTVDEDLRSSGALSHQLRPVLQLRVTLGLAIHVHIIHMYIASHACVMTLTICCKHV